MIDRLTSMFKFIVVIAPFLNYFFICSIKPNFIGLLMRQLKINSLDCYYY